MYDRIKDIFDNVNEWLKFAEAKHGGLIVLNSGILFGTLSLYKDYKDSIPIQGILVVFLFIVASLLMSFISLFPRSEKKIKKRKRPKKTNLYFSGDLMLFDEDTLKEELLRQTNRTHHFDGLETDLIQQIIANATVASRKYYLFKIAVILLIIGLTLPVGLGFYLLLG